MSCQDEAKTKVQIVETAVYLISGHELGNKKDKDIFAYKLISE